MPQDFAARASESCYPALVADGGEGWTVSLLTGGYIMALCLLVVYFVWENAPFHASHKAERVFVTSILLLVFASSVSWPYFESESAVSMWLTTLQFRQLLFMFVIARVMQNFVMGQGRPLFYDGRAGARVPAQRALGPPSLLAERVAEELERELEQGLPGPFDRFLKDAFPVMVLVLLMLQEQFILVVDRREATQISRLRKSDSSVSLADVCGVLQEYRQSQHYMALFWITVALEACCVLHIISKCDQLIGVGKHARAIDDLVRFLVQSADADCSAVRWVLSRVHLGMIMELASDSLDLLSSQHILESSVMDATTKAIVVHALQQSGLKRRVQQDAVSRIILSCQGEALTELKTLIDGGSDYNNLYKLVYKDLWESTRFDVVEHMQRESLRLRQQKGGCVGMKILSDIDDTLFSSGGKFPAGCDRTLPESVVYPGCLTLFRVLDRSWDPSVPSCNVVLLSARPHVYKDTVETFSYLRFNSLVEQGRLHSHPTMLPGELRLGIGATLCGCACIRGGKAWRHVGENKFESFKKFSRLYQEYDFVFFGDDGQGDLLAGEEMLHYQMLQEWRLRRRRSSVLQLLIPSRAPGILQRTVTPMLNTFGLMTHTSSSTSEDDEDESRSSDDESRQSVALVEGGDPVEVVGSLKAVLIHQVSNAEVLSKEDVSSEEDHSDPSPFQEKKARQLFMHRTYIGAACSLHRLKTTPPLVSLEQLHCVTLEAIKELGEIRAKFPDWPALDEAVTDHMADASVVADLLESAGRFEDAERLRYVDVYNSETDTWGLPKKPPKDRKKTLKAVVHLVSLGVRNWGTQNASNDDSPHAD